MVATALVSLRAFTRLLIGVLLIAVIAACGGGGGATTPAAATPASISFSPASLTAIVAPGDSATLTATATVSDATIFAGATALYAFIVDPQHLLSGAVNLSQIDSLNYSVTVYTSATLPLGRYQGAFQIQLCKDAACAAQFSVSPLSLPYDFVVTDSPISLSAASNSAPSMRFGGAAPADITFNVGAQSQTWTASTTATWLRVNNGSGSGNGQFTVSFSPNGLAVGVHSDEVLLTAADGETARIPVSLNLITDQRKLLPSIWGVGFSSTPTGSNLSRTLAVRDNFGGAISWTAVSDSAWLQVNQSGTTPGSSLTLTADPTSLPNTAVSYANVTLSSSVPGIAPAVVRVGLWKDSTAAAASTFLTTASLSQHIIADTIRPYVYVNDGATLTVYNAYTAQIVQTLSGVGSALGAMTVSPDGSLLYVLDTSAGKISIVNLMTMSVSTAWPLSAQVISATSVLAVRPNGQEVVLVGNGTAYSNGASLGSTALGEVARAASLAAPSDGSSVYTQDQGLSPTTVGAYDLDYSTMSGGTLMLSQRASGVGVNGSAGGGDIAISPDGTRLYTATNLPYACSSVNPQNLMPVGSLPGNSSMPNNVEVTQDGRVICGVSNVFSEPFDLFVYTAAGALISGYKSVSFNQQGNLTGQLVVTPDSFVVVSLTFTGISFVSIGP